MIPDEMPVAGLEEALTITLELGPMLRLGRLATGGIRLVRSVVGGGVDGKGGRGIVAGGVETLLARQDGVTTVEGNYMIVMSDGTPVRAFCSGYATTAPDFDGTRMTLLFEVDEASPHAWLATRVFLGERPAGTSTLQIMQVT